MEMEIVDKPIRFLLHGKSATVEDDCYGDVGCQLMNDIWKVVKEADLETTGINHWVYLHDGSMFVGVEVRNSRHASITDQLVSFEFELQRYLKHVHIGPYQELPQKWKALKSQLALRGDKLAFPSLEVYGHHCDDPSMAETTILIGLQPQRT